MSTSGNRTHFIKALIISAAASALLFVFGRIYDSLGRGVHSVYINYVFLIPLFLCVIPYGIMAIFKNSPRARFAFNLYNSGVALLCAGCILRGIVRIAGTTSRFDKYLILGGGAICLFAVGAYVVTVMNRLDEKEEREAAAKKITVAEADE